MHDTAFQIGCLAIDTYSDPSRSKILEIGSYDVNGSLRCHVGPDANYVGVDFEPGPGVNIVVAPGAAFPLEEDHFDLVIASSALEHDPAFWNTFLEMCRKARKGGYVYINVPSNGVVHRYPQDCWRFYPDSGRALAAWARSQGQDIKLVESFIAHRQNDIWNDFVAVFHKVGGYGKAPSQFLSEQFPCCNILRGETGDPINSVVETEDMLLHAEARSEVEGFREALATKQKQVEELSHQLDVVSKQMAANQMHYEILIVESRNEIAQISETAGKLESKLAETDAWIFRLAEERRAAEAEAMRVRTDLVQAEKVRNSAVEDLKSLEKTLHLCNDQKAILTTQLKHATDTACTLQSQVESFDWLQKVSAVLITYKKWYSFLPYFLCRKLYLHALVRRGLFDARQYCELYPDVRAEGMDPLRHYILHGLSEGRRIPTNK